MTYDLTRYNRLELENKQLIAALNKSTDELLQARLDVTRVTAERDLARRVAVHLEQELAEAEAEVDLAATRCVICAEELVYVPVVTP